MRNPRRPLPLLPSASRLAGAAVCVAPWSLELPRREETSEAAEWGRLCHAGAEALSDVQTNGAGVDNAMALLADRIAGGRHDAVALRRVLSHVDVALCVDRYGGIGQPWFVEQGIRYRRSFPLDEAELCDRAPGQEERGWFSGTADLVYVRADGVLVVVDWKFGHLTERIGDPAEEHWQLWFLALAFAAHLGIDLGDSSRVVAHVELRYVDEEGCRVDGADVTAGELAAFAASLGEIQERIEKGEAPRIGQACGRCSARHACDAYAGMTAKAIEAITGIAPPSPLFELPKTPEEAVALWRMVEAIERALPLARENVETFIRASGEPRGKGKIKRHRGIPLGMGLELWAKATKGCDDAIDTPEAIAAAGRAIAVAGHSADPLAYIEDFTVRTTSKKRIVDTWAKVTGKAKTGADARRFVASLKEAGVIVEGAPGVRLEVVRAEESEEE